MTNVYLGGPEEIRLDDLTLIHNPLDVDFVWPISGIDYTIPAKGDKQLPRWSCRIIAKHLADKILQEQYSVPDSNTDTPIRRKVLAEILPQEATEKGIVVSDEEAQRSLDSELERASKLAQTEKDPNHASRTKGRKKKVILPPTV